MKYNIQNVNSNKNITDRLLEIRWINEKIDDFLYPSYSKYWSDPFLLSDMQKATDRIIFAMKNKQRIMIFGDYDVDGITSSYILYTTFTKFFNYTNISVMFPDRLEDGYGLKIKHIDKMISKNVDLIITVDNGITAIQEALYTVDQKIDLIITDHHEVLNENIPNCFAVINPKISPKYPFKNLCWAGVSFKLSCALTHLSNFDKQTKQNIFKNLLPFVSIATVADIVPLVDENRLIVQKWLDQINKREDLTESLSWMLEYLKLWHIDSYHIGFVIWPRINAWWRLASAYDSFYTLLNHWSKQLEYLEIIEKHNFDRRSMQETMIKEIDKNVDLSENIIFYCSDWLHEWVVWIVAWRLTEKWNKPSIILKIDKEKWTATWSLRWPSYFSVIDMLQYLWPLLLRFGWHKQAWWMTLELENLDKVKNMSIEYCKKNISDKDTVKIINIDTLIFDYERNDSNLSKISTFGPFGEWNPEPSFLFQDCLLTKAEKIGQKWQWHIKLHIAFGDKKVQVMFWSKWDSLIQFQELVNQKIKIYWKIKPDNYNWWYFVDGIWREV